jgi:hypothetical protein
VDEVLSILENTNLKWRAGPCPSVAIFFAYRAEEGTSASAICYLSSDICLLFFKFDYLTNLSYFKS